MMGINHVLHGHRAVTVGVLGAVALLAIGVWGLVNLAEGDWVIGGLFVTSVLFAAPSLVSTVRRLHREDSGPSRPANTPPT